MSKTLSLNELHTFLSQAIGSVTSVQNELNEVQVQFVSAYETSKAAHDAALSELSRRAASDVGALPAGVFQAVQERIPVERETLIKRQQDLEAKALPAAEKDIDDLVAQAQQATQRVRELNPRLNEDEETLKAERARMEAELARLNGEIQQRSGCLKALLNFPALINLDRQRQKLLGGLEQNNFNLRLVRQRWAEEQKKYEEEERLLQQQWQQTSIDAARLREELAQLSDATRREKLILERAIFYVFDHWKAQVAPGSGALVGEINQMVGHNFETDAYEEGLGKAAGFIALLGGVLQGLQNIGESVRSLIDEQGMHSSYLKPLEVKVDDEVLRYHTQWGVLGKKVIDEKTLGQNPAQFSAMFDEETKGWLSRQNIDQMFNALGSGLSAAASVWKG